MSQKSNIEWTDATWNPVRGCDKVSPGCKHCYAEKFAERWRGIPGHPYEQGFDLRLVPEKLEEPLSWKRPRRIFVCSMSDLFHDSVPDKFIQQVFGTMAEAQHHTFQLLTKRPERANYLRDWLPWPQNVWLGTSVENQDYIFRIKHLLSVPAAVRFLSCEPLLGPLKLPLSNIRSPRLHPINWVICGGESGPGARPMRLQWVRSIRDQCFTHNVPFFFKQWGAIGEDGKRRSKKANGRELDGQIWNEFPIRE